MFQVGDSVQQKMNQLSDSPIHDSIFVNMGRIHTEYGFGAKYDYQSSDASGQYITYAQPANQQQPVTVVDMRDKLPTRPGANYPVRSTAIAVYCVHYTAGPPTQTVEQVAAYQVGPTAQLPFPAIAYHLFVDGAGKTYWCHDLNRRVWGSDGRYQGQAVNDVAVHACYAGNTQPNAKQLVGIRNGLLFSQEQLGRSLAIRGHKDDDATLCPGPHWPLWEPQIAP